MIRQALGASVEELFEEFEEVPVASGSIGQVYQAKLSVKGARNTGIDPGSHCRPQPPTTVVDLVVIFLDCCSGQEQGVESKLAVHPACISAGAAQTSFICKGWCCCVCACLVCHADTVRRLRLQHHVGRQTLSVPNITRNVNRLLESHIQGS